MLNWFGTRKINDEVFGKLEYRRYIFQKNFWKGQINFPHVLKEIDVYIIADRNGILKSQREFSLDLVNKYNESPDFFTQNLFEAFSDYNGKEFSEKMINLETIREDFQLERLFIPDFRSSEDIWELSYNFKKWSQSFTLHFYGWKFLYGTLDD